MSALIIPVPSLHQPESDPDQGCETFASKTSLQDSFISRAAVVDHLIDAKTNFVMESARLHALAESDSEHRERCFALIQVLEENIGRLQERIDQELKGLLYGLQKAPAPSRFIDDLPG